jgi:2,3-diketo-5-methylthio-1-phosphopentane phosphatase
MDKDIFIDFDGTITKKDTCFTMVETFADERWKQFNSLWEEKKLSTTDCAVMTFKLFNANLEDILKLMDTIEIDDYFKEFLSLCRQKGHHAYVLSDGYDVNIEAVFKRYGLEVKYYSNKLTYDSSKGFGIECPYENVSCGNCGTCKTNLIKKLQRKNSQIVYIGDGCSDQCPAAFADIVFAKGGLYNYCLEKSIQAEYFENFNDIISSGQI